MSHRQQALLDEFKVAIDRLPPTIAEVKVEAEKLYNDLLNNKEASERDVLDAMIRIGKQSYPHRHAIRELLATQEESKRLKTILDYLDEKVRAKLEQLLNGNIDEIVRGSMFDTDFSPEERYQIESAILRAKEKLRDDISKFVEDNRIEYDELVAKWKKHAGEIQAKLDELRSLAEHDSKWKAEIEDKISLFEQGWSVVERDPRLVDIEKEIEYWKGTLGMEE